MPSMLPEREGLPWSVYSVPAGALPSPTPFGPPAFMADGDCQAMADLEGRVAAGRMPSGEEHAPSGRGSEGGWRVNAGAGAWMFGQGRGADAEARCDDQAGGRGLEEPVQRRCRTEAAKATRACPGLAAEDRCQLAVGRCNRARQASGPRTHDGVRAPERAWTWTRIPEPQQSTPWHKLAAMSCSSVRLTRTTGFSFLSTSRHSQLRQRTGLSIMQACTGAPGGLHHSHP